MEYTDFDKNNGSFDCAKFIWKIKEARDCDNNLWHRKYSLTFTKVIVFVTC